MARHTLLGVQIDPLTAEELTMLVGTAIEGDHHWVIANHNLHSVYLYHRDTRLRELYSVSEVVHADGMSLIYWGRILGYPLERDHRVTYIDWLPLLLTASMKNDWRIFYLGGKPGVADKAAQILRDRHSGLQITTHHGYFAAEENERILDEIVQFQPHILLVGMGMPRQEIWTLDNLDAIHANAIMMVGGCFDYVTGEVPTPPRWSGRVGLEWFFRLVRQPVRLARRYLVEPWSLIPLAIQDVFGGAQPTSPSDQV